MIALSAQYTWHNPKMLISCFRENGQHSSMLLRAPAYLGKKVPRTTADEMLERKSTCHDNSSVLTKPESHRYDQQWEKSTCTPVKQLPICGIPTQLLIGRCHPQTHKVGRSDHTTIKQTTAKMHRYIQGSWTKQTMLHGNRVCTR